MKTSDLIGPALDWAVAACEGHSFTLGETEYDIDGRTYQRGGCSVERRYSTDWAQGGPVIERQKIQITPRELLIRYAGGDWLAGKPMPAGPSNWAQGPTPLVAAMRCYLASKLGDDIELPGSGPLCES